MEVTEVVKVVSGTYAFNLIVNIGSFHISRSRARVFTLGEAPAVAMAKALILRRPRSDAVAEASVSLNLVIPCVPGSTDF